MTTFSRGRPVRPIRPASPSSPRRRPSAGRTGRPFLSLVRDADPYGTPVDLRNLIGAPMPADAKGVLVTAADAAPGGKLQGVWLPVTAPEYIPPGQVLLHWTPVDEDRMDVSARLGLARGQVLLATWPGLRGDWCDIVRPTVAEVRGLHAALRLATAVLNRLSG